LRRAEPARRSPGAKALGSPRSKLAPSAASCFFFLILDAGLAAAPVAAPDCARYAMNGILPGMSYEQVRKRSDRAADLVEISRGAGVVRSVLTTFSPPATIRVELAGDVQRKPKEAWVVSVRSCVEKGEASLEEIARRLVARFGPPLGSPADFGRALEAGQARWQDPSCGLELRAFVQGGAWWKAGGLGICAEVRQAAPEEPLFEAGRGREPGGEPGSASEKSEPRAGDSAADPGERSGEGIAAPPRSSRRGRAMGHGVGSPFPEPASPPRIEARVLLEGP
jgi:hypothetical protein